VFLGPIVSLTSKAASSPFPSQVEFPGGRLNVARRADAP
jgi:hypothetical protein